MTIIELKDEQKVLNEKIAALIKEFEGKCQGAIVSYVSIERLNSFTLGNDAIIINTENDKLETLCNYFNIDIDAHNALSDILATKQLCEILVDKYINKKDENEIYGK